MDIDLNTLSPDEIVSLGQAMAERLGLEKSASIDADFDLNTMSVEEFIHFAGLVEEELQKEAFAKNLIAKAKTLVKPYMEEGSTRLQGALKVLRGHKTPPTTLGDIARGASGIDEQKKLLGGAAALAGGSALAGLGGGYALNNRK